MQAQQMRSALAHGIHVQLVVHPPHQPVQMRRRRAAHEQAEQVFPLKRGKPRVPVVVHGGAIDNRHGGRFQVIIDRLGQPERVPCLVHIAMGHLRQRVHARIGAPCGGYGVGAWFQLCQCSLDRTLNRWLVRLPLPSDEWRTMIFDF